MLAEGVKRHPHRGDEGLMTGGLALNCTSAAGVDSLTD